MTSILVTGSSGFIAKHLVPELLQSKYKVIKANRKEGDIADEACWLKFPKVDVVIHLAGKSFVPDSWLHPEDFIKSNFLGTLEALKFCRKHGAKLIFLSSYLYGNPKELPIIETAPISVNNPYALSKKLSEDACSFYASHFQLNITLFRLFNVYGPGQAGSFLIPTIIKSIVQGQSIKVKDLEPKRDYVHVKDVTSAILKSITLGTGYRVFNIGSGRSYSVEQLIEIIQNIQGTNLPVISRGERRKDEIMNTVADISKAKQELNWQPYWSLQKGLEQILQEERYTGATANQNT